jgi:hypothetical protein
MKKVLFVWLFAVLIVSFAFASSVVTFKNGKEVTYGSVERQGDQYCTYANVSESGQQAAGLFCFPAEDVASVKELKNISDTNRNVAYNYSSSIKNGNDDYEQGENTIDTLSEDENVAACQHNADCIRQVKTENNGLVAYGLYTIDPVTHRKHFTSRGRNRMVQADMHSMRDRNRAVNTDTKNRQIAPRSNSGKNITMAIRGSQMNGAHGAMSH